MIKKLIAASAIVALAGCSTVTIHPKSAAKLSSNPTFEESQTFYLWGLVGENRINVSEICGSKGPLQMQTQQTFVDGLLGGITLGIYAPHTAKVWCK
ncbi:MAG: Bor family protein [Saccharospirillaceae bacterium]|nr:Bor family protein [Saccharospirillaceae bacterium]